MYCNQCGKKLSEDAFFCSNCGTPVERQGLKKTKDTDSFDDTMLFTEKEKESIRFEGQQDNKTRNDLGRRKEKRPTWLDEKDDPALYENVKSQPKEELNADKKGNKKFDASKVSGAFTGFAAGMKAKNEERKIKRAENKVTIDDVPEKEKPVFTFFQGKKEEKGASSVSDSGKSKEDVNETFMYLYIGVVTLAVVIGIILGLLLIQPWQKTDEAKVPVSTIHMIAPMDTIDDVRLK